MQTFDMDPYGSIWTHMGPYGPYGPSGLIWVHMDPISIH